MSSWGVIFDSSCGYKQDEVHEMGAGFIPFKINYEGVEYNDGVDIFTENIAERSRVLQIAKTAAPSPSIIEGEISRISKKYDKVLIVTLSKNLSGMNNAVRLVASQDEYKDNVYVLDSLIFGNWIQFLVPRIIKWQKEGKSFDEVIEIVKDYNENLFASVLIDDLQFLSAGGRISQAQARLGNLAGIKPVLVIKDGKIDETESYKTRNFKKAIDKICQVINNYIEDNDLNKDDYYLSAPYIGEQEDYENIKKLIKERITGIEFNDEVSGIPRSIVLVYTGVNTTGIGINKKI